MAKKISSTNSPKEISQGTSLDINLVKLNLLIVCNDVENVRTIGAYLNRRGWQAHITGNMREGFKQIAAIKPDFVLISVNTDTNKLASLPNVIFQTFMTPVVLFGETVDTFAIKGLKENDSNFKIHGLASGPAIHRSLKNFILEMSKSTDPIYLKKCEDLSRNSNFNSSVDDEELIWKKQGKGIKFPLERDRNHLPKSEVENEYWKTEKGNRTKVELANSEEDFQRSPSEELASLSSKYFENKEKSYKPVNKNTKEISLADLDKDFSKKNLVEDEKTETNKIDNFGEVLDRNLGEPPLEINNNNLNKDFSFEEFSQLLFNTIQNCCHIVNEVQIDSNKENSYFFWPINIKDITTILIFKLFGSMAQTRLFRKNFLEKLFAVSQTLPYPIKFGEMFLLDKEVDFSEPLSGELFCKKFEDQNFETEFKYIKLIPLKTELEASKVGGKFKINPKDLVEGLPAGVNVYIYLPINNKFIRYLGSNTKVSLKQKTILVGSQAFIDPEDIVTYEENYTRNKSIEMLIKKSESKIKNST